MSLHSRCESTGGGGATGAALTRQRRPARSVTTHTACYPDWIGTHPARTPPPLARLQDNTHCSRRLFYPARRSGRSVSCAFLDCNIQRSSTSPTSNDLYFGRCLSNTPSLGTRPANKAGRARELDFFMTLARNGVSQTRLRATVQRFRRRG